MNIFDCVERLVSYVGKLIDWEFDTLDHVPPHSAFDLLAAIHVGVIVLLGFLFLFVAVVTLIPTALVCWLARYLIDSLERGSNG